MVDGASARMGLLTVMFVVLCGVASKKGVDGRVLGVIPEPNDVLLILV